MIVKIMGERNTGTRFLSALVKANFYVELIEDYGWKHAKYHSIPRDVLVLTISKRPDAWLKSLYRRPYEMSRRSSIKVDYSLMKDRSPVLAPFDVFIRARWMAIPRDRVCQREYITALDLYHEKLRSYVLPARRFHVRYEDLVANVCAVLAALPLPRRAGEWVIPARSTKESGGRFETTEEVMQRYLNPPPMDYQDRRFIEDRWEWLNERFGATLQP